jgi:protein polybromo-1
VIKDPIDLRTVAKKIQTSGYTTLEDMVKDLFLMVNNAKSFNKPGSIIYKVTLPSSVFLLEY